MPIVKLLDETLEYVMTLFFEPDEEHPQNLYLDAGYQEKVQKRGYTIRPCGEKER